MKALLTLTFWLLLITHSSAAIIISPGVSINNAYKTKEINSPGIELVKFDAAMGITLEGEWTFLNDSISLMGGLLWNGSEATTQYSYTNPSNPLDTATVADLETNASSFVGFLGPRFRFLNLKYFKIFAGAGIAPGILYLTYNESKFILSNGSKVGFREKEQQNLHGTYFEAGLELYSTKGGAIRLLGRQAYQRTKAFKTLGDKRINLKNSQLAIQYMHLF